jgi:hypothetical protein
MLNSVESSQGEIQGGRLLEGPEAENVVVASVLVIWAMLSRIEPLDMGPSICNNVWVMIPQYALPDLSVYLRRSCT